ncbi:hypothetical protein SLA2020_142540 [Shorea laevis]
MINPTISSRAPHNKAMVDVPFLPRDPEPWGWNDWKAWDDGVFFGILKLSVSVKDYGAIKFKGVQILYEGKSDTDILTRMSFLSECHGNCVGETQNQWYTF